MTIRKLMLPTLIAAALAVPNAFAQQAQTADKAVDAKATATRKADAEKDKADAAKSDARKDKQAGKDKAARKDAGNSKDEQPDEPEEDGR